MRFTYCFLCFLSLTLFGCNTGTQEMSKPNVLFLLTDDQRADALGFVNDHIQTPNLDELARNGVHFTNNFCMGSHHGAVCAPSRAMIMSAKSLFNVYDKLQGVPTMPKTWRDHGYITFGTGKWHNEREVFAQGFEVGTDVFLGGMSDHFRVPVRQLQGDGTFSEVTYKPFSTDLFADATISFLRNYRETNEERPFFAYVAFTAPHDPRSPNEAWIGKYSDSAIPPPENFKPLHPFNNGDLLIRDEHLGAFPRTEEQISRQLADYYGLINHIDRRVGDIISTLKQQNLYDNTIIVFTSDHGLAVGSHGLLGKQSLYEHSMKSPLIISGPGIPKNEKRGALVYLYDLFPTLNHFLGIANPAGIEGKDLHAVILGKETSVRTSLFTAYRNTQRAVRNERWKLIQYPRIEHTQLFDLEKDPHELNNLADEPSHADKVAEMTALLKRWQTEKNDTIALTADHIADKKYDLTDYLRYPDPHQPVYTMKKYFPEVFSDPLRKLHYLMVRAAWYEDRSLAVTRDINRLIEELNEHPENKKAFIDKVGKPRTKGSWIKFLPRRNWTSGWKRPQPRRVNERPWLYLLIFFLKSNTLRT